MDFITPCLRRFDTPIPPCHRIWDTFASWFSGFTNGPGVKLQSEKYLMLKYCVFNMYQVPLAATGIEAMVPFATSGTNSSHVTALPWNATFSNGMSTLL